MKCARAAFDDIEWHHPLQHRVLWKGGTQHVRIANAVLEAHDDRAGAKHVRQFGGGRGGRGRLDGDEHEIGCGGAGRVCRYVDPLRRHMPAAIVVPRQRDAMTAQLVGHARTPNETDVAAPGKKSSADIATN